MKSLPAGLLALLVSGGLYAAGCGGGATGATTGGTTGTTSSGSGGAASTGTSSATGGSGGGGGAMVCMPGSKEACYEGPAATEGVGVCKAGARVCAADGSGFGACEGQVLPAVESCTTPVDDDCNGTINDASVGCVCDPGSAAPCYGGPAGTLGVGLCVSGTKACAADGKAYEACMGEVLPTAETCATPGDDDCNGQANEGGAGCACVPGAVGACYSGPPVTEGVGPCVGGSQVCNDLGVGFGPCVGEVVPAPESCATPVDDDCNGQINEGGVGCVCPPSAMVPCYDGPAGTGGVGACHGGLALCNDQGTALGPCAGQVIPAPESCDTPVDDDCNGQVNEGGLDCVCAPNATVTCYEGPVGTMGVGICKSGSKQCNALGTAYGACVGQVLPQATETCLNGTDDTCDGQINEGCPVVGYAANAKPIFQALCSPCHFSQNVGGSNFAQFYAASQQPAIHCPNKTVGACAMFAIQSGQMPPGAGCSGNPALDVGKPGCLTAMELGTIQAWVAGGQKP